MITSSFPRLSRLAAVIGMAAVLGGCASQARNPVDPYEGYNRAMYSFNEGLDQALIKPLGQAYDAVTPRPVRTGIGNFFGNIGDVWIGANNLMQGKGAEGLSDLMRVAVNSTFGLLGMLDVASEMGLTKHDEDFGQTLAVWGVSAGGYFVLPVFGPRTVRDAAAFPMDYAVDQQFRAKDIPTRNILTGIKLAHGRAALLGADKTLAEGTIDKYAYVRDFYLQQRDYKVHDGNPPPPRYEDFDTDPAPATR